MLYIVIAYLWASICLYLLLGGADFGAGIVEFVSRGSDRQRVRRIMYRAIGPVWEANHMWLIIAIVILFAGFPLIYSTISTYMHIPLVLMLLGIIARGTAFSFRNYDAVQDDLQSVYSHIFTLASLITPFFLGIIAAATISGSIDHHTGDFLSSYVFSWLNPFGIATGLFTVAICGYLASVYIIGILSDPYDIRLMTANIKRFICIAIILGALVFFIAYLQRISLLVRVFGSITGQAAIALATLSLIAQVILFKGKHYLRMRFIAAFQIVMILLAVIFQHYPIFLSFQDGSALSLAEDENNRAAIYFLGLALLSGSVLILPALFYLMYSFDKKRITSSSPSK